MSLKDDMIDDALEFGGEMVGMVMKTVLAYIALHDLGHLSQNEAFGTAALLGATDFFARRGRSRVVRDVKSKITAKLPGGGKVTEETSDYESRS